MAIYIDYEDQPTPATELSWLELAPCGCVVGMTYVEHHDRTLATATEAWAYLHECDSAARTKADEKAGYTVRLGRRSDVALLRVDCPHDPKWGVTATAIPDGYVWAQPNFRTYVRDRRHIVPGQFDDDGYLPPLQGSDGKPVTALCGREQRSWYSRHPEALVECMRCAKAASTIVDHPSRLAGVA
jgi:hypothetical protein